MNDWDWDWASTNSGRSAIGAAALSAALMIWTLVHAVRIEPVPEFPSAQFAAGLSLAVPASTAATDIEAAVQADLFATDRSAPAHRYRVPGEESDEAPPKEAPVLPVVLGTAVSDESHSFATVQLAEGRAVIVHVGDKIGEYSVKSIGRGSVVFTTKANKRLEIPELKP